MSVIMVQSMMYAFIMQSYNLFVSFVHFFQYFFVVTIFILICRAFFTLFLYICFQFLKLFNYEILK